MSPSYLSENDLMQWIPWFWMLSAYKWSADQGRAVPPFTMAWREPNQDLADHIGALTQIWFPDATEVYTEGSPGEGGFLLRWRDPRLTAWRAALRHAPLIERRPQLVAYREWVRTMRAISQAKVQAAPWFQITVHHDHWTWRFDSNNFDGFWEENPIVDLVHWFQTLYEHRVHRIPTFPEVTLP